MESRKIKPLDLRASPNSNDDGFEATISRVYDSHLIQAQASAVSRYGDGFWVLSIEEPGGRCIYQEVEIGQITQVRHWLHQLEGIVDDVSK